MDAHAARIVLLAVVRCCPRPRPRGAQSATGSIAGVVVDAGTGAPLERARVSLDGHEAARALEPQGRFVLADLPAGRGVLEVSLIGYALVRRDVDVPAGGTLELTSRSPRAPAPTPRTSR